MTVAPTRIEEVRDAVRANDSVIVRGAGTKSDASAPDSRSATIDLRGLNGVTAYSPDECVFSAQAGAPIRTIAAMLAAHGQYLPFDPPFESRGATIGGTVAAGVSGPCRHRYGGVRDFIIGARIVDGEGRLITSGGKVVKNAAGFLLHHGIVGSLGAFGVITDVTFKVFPRPEARVTLEGDCGSLARALDGVRALHAARFELEALDFDDSGRLWIRLAGRHESMTPRIARVRAALGTETVLLQGEADERTWSDAREFTWAAAGASIVRVPVPPSRIDPTDAWPATRFSGGGTMAWIAWPGDVSRLSDTLAARGLGGQVIRGAGAGCLIGRLPFNEFEARVRRALDPTGRFRAASHSDR